MTFKQASFMVSAALCASLLLGASDGQGVKKVTNNNFLALKKVDAHCHNRASSPDFLAQYAADNFKANLIILDLFDIPMQENYLAIQRDLHPGRFTFSTTFTMKGWDEPGWQANTIERLGKAFQEGATSVKVWKNIGMVEKDKDGKFIMIDHPRFDPIFDFIAKHGRTLTGHLGEPRDCWLPADKMVAPSNRRYYENNPEYHMYLHPEYPSYEDQIAAFDHMLEKHPTLQVVGAHLASMEWSPKELAKRLDRYPNLSVDLAARIDDLQCLDRDEVREFFIAHQDRILYGTDLEMLEDGDPAAFAKRAHETWLQDWTCFATDEEIEIKNFENPVKGLKLPAEVLEYIYHRNAERLYPGL